MQPIHIGIVNTNALTSDSTPIVSFNLALADYIAKQQKLFTANIKIRSDITTIPDDFTIIAHVHNSKYGIESQYYGLFRNAHVAIIFSPHLVDIYIAATEDGICINTLEFFKIHYKKSEISEDKKILMSFWYYSDSSCKSIRTLIVPDWNDIAENYPEREKIQQIISWDRIPGGGKLLLFNGPPGTGKTFLIRALGYEWRKWCSLHYITDPEVLFGGKADYLVQLLLRESADREINRAAPCDDRHCDEDHDEEENTIIQNSILLVLEDTGELLSKDAKERTGQGLSRLLNLVDGILGQGFNVMILITTNEDLGRLHPAVTRPGRCIANIQFKPFNPSQARTWLARYDIDVPYENRMYTIADLYAIKENRSTIESSNQRKVGFS